MFLSSESLEFYSTERLADFLVYLPSATECYPVMGLICHIGEDVDPKVTEAFLHLRSLGLAFFFLPFARSKDRKEICHP